LEKSAVVNINLAIIAYIPVLHRGYKHFLHKHLRESDGNNGIFLIGAGLLGDFSYLQKDIRNLEPTEVAAALQAWGFEAEIKALDHQDLETLAAAKTPVIIPREDVTEAVVERYLPDNPVTKEEVFLRWNKNNTDSPAGVDPARTVNADELAVEILAKADSEAALSSDWWRRVGAVLFRGDEVLLTGHNHHLPTDHEPYFSGDPRAVFSKGVNIELSTAIHAEASLIASAAKQGLRIQGAAIYVTTFPCPPCAKLIAQSGLKRLYYREGYAMLDGQAILADAGVEIVQVTDNP
jgi:dCMP deaminase